MITPNFATMALLALEKAVTADVIQDLVPEDLEGEAHNTLWRASSANELTLLKLIPNIGATSIEHQFDQILSYGETRGFGEFSETSLPLSTKGKYKRMVTNIRLIGEMTDVYLLASLQKTIKVNGATGAEAISKQNVLLNMLRKKNKAYYFMDTSVTRLGADGMRFKGIIQQIREGTDGTVGSSPYGSHVIDMEGQPLTVDTLRSKIAKIITLFGYLSCLIMDPLTRSQFETSLDSAQRLNLPTGFKPLMFGQNVGGIQSQGGDMIFHTDNSLSPLYAQGQYIAEAVEGAPTSPPIVTLTINSSATSPNVSKWKSGDAQDAFWIVTELKNGRESLGRRVPSSGTIAIGVNGEAQFDIVPSDPLSDGFKVYRCVLSTDNDTETYGIFEVANSGGGGSVRAYDLNHFRPNTGFAFGLCIRSEVEELMASTRDGTRSSYNLAKLESERFLGQPDSPQNTVTAVSLGPTMGTMNIANFLPTVARPMLYSATTMQIRNPLQNMVFINVGSNAING